MEYDGMKMKTGLQAWAEKYGVSINDFCKQMEYTYAHGWGLLHGKVAVSRETFGRFCLAFGLEASQELMQLAGYPTELPRPEEAQPVPVVYIEGKKD